MLARQTTIVSADSCVRCLAFAHQLPEAHGSRPAASRRDELTSTWNDRFLSIETARNGQFCSYPPQSPDFASLAWKASYPSFKDSAVPSNFVHQMPSNPYQTPTAISEPGRVLHTTVADNESGCLGVSHRAFRQHRRAAICLILSISLFSALISIDMFRRVSIVDGVISLIFPVVLLAVTAKMMSWRTTADTEITLERYSDVANNMRRHCLWTGPALCAVGVAQMARVPARWQLFVCPCLASGPLIFGCAFLWPRVLAPDNSRQQRPAS